MEYQKKFTVLVDAITDAVSMSKKTKGVEFQVIKSKSDNDSGGVAYFVESGGGFVRTWETHIGTANNGKFEQYNN